ncbi:MAG: cytidylate kinase-like family protein [Chloroflexi bacterium]|nr:cytidylate kinase-like family protein [Chloroflexota bacterium]
MPVITIRGHSGSLTSEIARMMAYKLDAHVMDRQILHEVSKRLEIPVEEVEEMEKVPLTRRDRILDAFSRLLQQPWAMVAGPPGHIGVLGLASYYEHLPQPTDANAYRRALEEIVHDLATDDSVVFTGKGTQVMLRQQERAFHVFVTAPLELRVKRIMARNGISEAEARAMIARIDGHRKAYLKRYFKVDLEDLRLYDVVINTAKIDVKTAVDTIIHLSRSAQSDAAAA